MKADAMVGVAVRGQSGEWQRVGQTERISGAGGRDVNFAQAVPISVNAGSQYRFAVYDIRSLINDAAFLHIGADGLVGEAVVSGAQLASGQAIDVALQKDGKDTGSRVQIAAAEKHVAATRFSLGAAGELCIIPGVDR